MIKKLALAAFLACAAVAPAGAKNLALPSNNPIATMWVPDNWSASKIENGWEATSPDGGIYFSVEYATGERGVQKLTKQLENWVKKNKIKLGAPKEQEIEMAGLKASMMSFSGTYDGADTELHITFVPAGPNRVLMFTVWGNQEEQQANLPALQKMMNSFKTID